MSVTVAPAELKAGTWTIDPSHSDVAFSVRHLMVSKVRGTFSRFSGTIAVAEDPLASTVDASIDVASVDTRDPGRDAHLQSADFFDAERFPAIDFKSVGIRALGDRWLVDGMLTVKDVTRPVTLDLEINGVATDPWGGTRAGFSASTEISRRDFGVDHVIPWDGGGVGGAVVGDKISISLEVEAVLDAQG